MKVITAIYLHVRPDLRDEWLAGVDVDADVEESLVSLHSSIPTELTCANHELRLSLTNRLCERLSSSSTRNTTANTLLIYTVVPRLDKTLPNFTPNLPVLHRSLLLLYQLPTRTQTDSLLSHLNTIPTSSLPVDPSVQSMSKRAIV